MVEFEHFFTVGSAVFFIGMIGMFTSKDNFMFFLLSMELLLLGVVINIASYGMFYNVVEAQILVLFMLGVGAAEAAVGLIILLYFFRSKGSVSSDDMNVLGEK